MKKLFSIIILFSMLLTLLVPVSATVAVDVCADEAACVEDLLSRLNIAVSEGDAPVTRQEFAVLIAQIGGIYDYSNDVTECVFSDINGAMTGLMNDCVRLGWFTVPENGLFRPNDAITVREAAIVCVRVLGYGDLVADKGDTAAYLKFADRLDLFDGVRSDGFTNRDVKQMLYNTLLAGCAADEMQHKKSTSPGDVTLLEQVYGIEPREGRIESIQYVALTGYSEAGRNRIKIDGSVFELQEDVPYSFLGATVRYFVTGLNNEDVIFAVYMKKQTDSVTLTADDIASINSGLDTVEYYREDKLQKLRLATDLTAIYNNDKLFGISADTLQPQNGSVVFTDTDHDGRYDLAVIEEYTYYTVSALDAAAERIYDADKTSALEVNTQAKDSRDRIVMQDGAVTTFSKLAIGDVLEVLYTPNAKTGKPDSAHPIEVRVLTQKVTGMVQGLSQDDHTVKVGETTYDYISELDGELYLGNTYDFAIGTGGKLVTAKKSDKSSAKEVYGYLVAARREKQLSSNLQVKMFTQDGEMKIFNTTDRISVSGEINGAYYASRVLTADEFLNVFNEGQLVRYAATADGMLTKVVKAADYSALSDYDGYSDVFSCDYATTQGRFFDNKANDTYFYNASSLVFAIPESGLDDDFSVGGYTMLGEVKNQRIKLYDCTESFYVKAAVVSIADDASLDTSIALSNIGDAYAALITGNITTLSSTGEEITGYKAWFKGKEIVLYAKDEKVSDRSALSNYGSKDDEIFFKDLKPGDMIVYSTNTKGEVEKMEVVFRYNGGAATPFSYNGDSGQSYLSELQTFYGKATKCVSGKYFMTENSATRRFHYYKDSGYSQYIYEYDVNTGKVNVLSSVNYLETDGEHPDYVFIKARKTTVRDIVIYKNR